MARMEIGGFRKMNWFPKEPAWKALERARAKRREMIADFNMRSYNLAAAFNAAFTNRIGGEGDLAAQTAVSRLQTDLKTRADQLEKNIGAINKLV